jgi:hypothetical protein
VSYEIVIIESSQTGLTSELIRLGMLRALALLSMYGGVSSKYSGVLSLSVRKTNKNVKEIKEKKHPNLSVIGCISHRRLQAAGFKKILFLLNQYSSFINCSSD